MTDPVGHLWAVIASHPDREHLLLVQTGHDFAPIVSDQLGVILAGTDLTGLAVDLGLPVRLRHFEAVADEGTWWPDGTADTGAPTPLNPRTP
jgi:hypothetical protein